MGNRLIEYFDNNKNERIHKWSHYFEIYDFHFNKYVDKPISILEIGVSHGGSLKMWRDYFGKEVFIYGIDIDERCKKFEDNKTMVFIGSQSDSEFLRNIISQTPKFDIIIDDGGHTMQQQITSFKELYSHLNEGGIYLCEDVHTSYWLTYGGGYKRRGTFIEYAKGLVDSLNAWHSEQSALKVSKYTKSITSICFYDSIVLINKGLVNEPKHLISGDLQFDDVPVSLNWKAKMLRVINKVLRYFKIKSFRLGQY